MILMVCNQLVLFSYEKVYSHIFFRHSNEPVTVQVDISKFPYTDIVTSFQLHYMYCTV